MRKLGCSPGIVQYSVGAITLLVLFSWIWLPEDLYKYRFVEVDNYTKDNTHIYQQRIEAGSIKKVNILHL